MVRRLYDSVNASRIPSDAQLVAGYVDGAYKWSLADWGHWAHVPQVRLAVLATTNDGNCADVERGNMDAQQFMGWLAMRRAAGMDPSVYCGWADWMTIQQLCSEQGVSPPHHWLAWWNSDQAIYLGDSAHQYINGVDYDSSAAADYWPGVDLPTTPEPPGQGGDIVTEAQVQAVIDRYLASDIQQGPSAQALIKALVARIGAAGKALSLDQPVP